MSQSLEATIVRVRGGAVTEAQDRLAIERPLEIRARVGDFEQVLSTTMRTPGDDPALAVGFLHAEGLLSGAPALRRLEQIGEDVVLVELAGAEAGALEARARRFVTSS